MEQAIYMGDIDLCSIEFSCLNRGEGQYRVLPIAMKYSHHSLYMHLPECLDLPPFYELVFFYELVLFSSCGGYLLQI